MNRREMLATSAAAGAVAAAGVVESRAAERKPSNVLFILTDQWRGQAFGYAGDVNVQTPHIDRLAAESLNFVNAVSVCPVCTPHRAALMTGRYPTSTGMFLNDLYLPDEERCLAEVFHDGGYTTGYIGKWHLDGHGRSSYIPPRRRQGFDYWRAAECDHNYPHSHYYAGTSEEMRHWEGFDAFAQTRDAQAFLRAHQGQDRPYFLVVSYGGPHFPHDLCPEAYTARYPADQLQLRPNVTADMADWARKELVGYYAHCSILDDCVGKLLESLRNLEAEEDTLVIFTSDHGEMMGSHGWRPFAKQTVWNESASVPFLLRWPGHQGTGGRVVRTPITTPDIMPTLLSLVGLESPDTVEGRDFSPLVRERGDDPDNAALYMSVVPFNVNQDMHAFRAIRTARHTYARNLEGPWLLFDNEADPYQQQNLLDQPEHAALRRDLDAQLGRELERIGDAFHPREHYVRQWGYQVDENWDIPYADGAAVQTPRQVG